MRVRNERLVLSMIRRQGAMAKAELARESGLSAQTVSVIMRQLEADGLLVKGDPVRGKVGQPSVPMRLRPDGALFLGLKVGRRSVELVMTDFLGKVLHRRINVHSHPTPHATITFAVGEITDMIAQLPDELRQRIAGLGIAMPYFLWDWAQTLGVPASEMADWRDIDIRAEIAKRFAFPVFLQNDASAACAAELVFGPPDTPRDFLYFYVGYFIGGGVVLNGALFVGNGNSGALGPLPVPTETGVCQLIDVASLTVLESDIQAAGSDTAAMWRSSEDWGFDPVLVDQWIERASAGLAHSIATACSVIDFSAVLVDGWIPVSIRNRLVAAIDRHLDALNLTGLSRPDILAGTVGADARVLGAASLPLSDRFLID